MGRELQRGRRHFIVGSAFSNSTNVDFMNSLNLTTLKNVGAFTNVADFNLTSSTCVCSFRFFLSFEKIKIFKVFDDALFTVEVHNGVH